MVAEARKGHGYEVRPARPRVARRTARARQRGAHGTRDRRVRVPRLRPDRLGAGAARPGRPGDPRPRRPYRAPAAGRAGGHLPGSCSARTVRRPTGTRSSPARSRRSSSGAAGPSPGRSSSRVEPAFWGPFFDYLAFRPVLEVTFDDRRHVVYGNDWRRFPVDIWLDLMNEREHSGGTGPPPDWMQRPAPLGRDAFGAAVRVALTATAPARPARPLRAGRDLAGRRPGGRTDGDHRRGGRPRRRPEGRPDASRCCGAPT